MPADPSLDLQALQLFVALAEAGSLQATARATGLSRATLRRRVEALEATVGVPLHERGPHGVFLTTAGEAVLAEARDVLGRAAALVETARRAAHQPLQEVRILAPDGLPPALVALLVAQARAHAPGAHLELTFAADPLQEDRHGYDLTVHWGDAPASGSWVTRRLLAAEERLLASREWLDAHGEPETLDELCHHTLFTWSPPGEDPAAWPLRGGGAVRVQPAVRSPDIHLIRQLMLMGSGIARVPDGGVPDRGWDAEVVPVLDGVVGCTRVLRLLLPQGLHRTPRMRALVELFHHFDLPG